MKPAGGAIKKTVSNKATSLSELFFMVPPGIMRTSFGGPLWGIAFTSSEALEKSNNEKRLNVGVGSAAEIVVLVAYSKVKDFLRESVSFDFLDFSVFDLESVIAFDRHKLDSICRSEEHTSELQSH